MGPDWELRGGDCRDVLAFMPDNSVDSIVCDPPYELNFMSKKWDATGIAYSVHMWSQVLRVLKPGGHLVAFSATRTYHRMACAVEDAGFEIRDQLAWVFGQGFPKSLDISKVIDKEAGAEREVIGYDAARARPNGKYEGGAIGKIGGSGKISDRSDNGATITAPATEEAKKWAGFGTALKPAQEPILLARKPCSEKTVAANVLKWGTGALNIDACRIELQEQGEDPRLGGKGSWKTSNMAKNCYGKFEGAVVSSSQKGRWPANVVHDGSDEVLSCFPDAPGQQGSLVGHNKNRESPNGVFGKMAPAKDALVREETNKSAARFFYCAKANKTDRVDSKHPTVKPVALMRWLCRLVNPKNGLILDPFAGSGTTGQAALAENFRVILIEREPEYQQDIIRRMSRA
jgi:site-specific DNA-methyltransferase (adenine-specific)